MIDHGAAPRRREGSRQFAKKADEGANAAAVAGYIADMTAQMESMAAAAGLDLVGYFLAMARAESEAAAQGAGEEGKALRPA